MTPMFILAVLIKGLLVLSIALGLSLLFRRASAAVRHGVWVAAFVALLALPVLEVMGPKWSVPVGYAPSAVEGILPPMAPTPPVPPVPPVPPLAPDAGVFALERHAAQMEHQAARLERRAEKLAARAERQMELEIHRMERQIERDVARMEQVAHRQLVIQNSGSAAPIVRVTSPASVVQTIRSVPREIVMAMLWFWGLGALAVGLMWSLAYAAAARAVRIGTPETDEERLATWERVRILSGITQPVRLLRSPALDVPIAWGWREAAVVLPESADEWDEDRLEAVLLHELAHVIRGDALSQLIAQIALVLHWANPLAWLAYRSFLLEREHACDDVVLEHGARPSAYADHLVQVARDLRRRSAALAAVAPMARRSDLEDRVLSILDPAKKRATLSRAAGATLTLLLCTLALPVAALQPVAATAPESQETAQAVMALAPKAPIAQAWTVAGIEDDAEQITVEIQETTKEGRATELAMQLVSERPFDLNLALDTIPRFEEVIRPALEAALEAVRAMRKSERHGQLIFSEEDWDDMEEGIQESIEDARENYDEAIEEAIEDALEDLEAEDWEISWSDQPDGARVGGYTSEAALSRARRDVERAQEDAQRALRDAHRTLQRQFRDAERSQRRVLQRNQQRAAQNQARAEARVRSGVQRSSGQSTSYSYSVPDDGVVISQSNGSGLSGWVSGLDGFDESLSNIERSIRQIERSSSPPQPGVIGRLSGGLRGIDGGLSGVANGALAAPIQAAERLRVTQRIEATRARVRELQERLEDCGD